MDTKFVDVAYKYLTNIYMNLSSWWLNQPIKNKYARQIGSFPQVGGMNIQK